MSQSLVPPVAGLSIDDWDDGMGSTQTSPPSVATPGRNRHSDAPSWSSRLLTPNGACTMIKILARYSQQSGLLRLLLALPHELLHQVCSSDFGQPQAQEVVILDGTKNPAVPPRDMNKRPFENLPVELFRQIIAKSLPAKDVIIKCDCGTAHSTKGPKRMPKRNTASDLMSLNSTLKDVVKEVVYAERTFAIHVHQGVDNGGIEVLDAGRQPLQYKASSGDDRFDRFSNRDEFGFRAMKKVEITIFPGEEDVKSKVTTISTYYINLALVRLLEREDGKEGKNRMTSITIIFAEPPISDAGTPQQTGRRNIMNGENYWWDGVRDEPRTTAIHNLSDIELSLRPFQHMTGVHNVRIELPIKARSHKPTTDFVEALIKSMEGNDELSSIEQKFPLRNNMEILRQDVEDHIFERKYGTAHRRVEAMSADEALDLEPDVEDDDSPYSVKRGTSTASDAVNKRRKLVETKEEKLQKWRSIGVDSDSDNDDSGLDWRTVLDGSLMNSKRDVLDEQRVLLEQFGNSTGQRLRNASPTTVINNNNLMLGNLRAELEARRQIRPDDQPGRNLRSPAGRSSATRQTETVPTPTRLGSAARVLASAADGSTYSAVPAASATTRMSQADHSSPSQAQQTSMLGRPARAVGPPSVPSSPRMDTPEGSGNVMREANVLVTRRKSEQTSADDAGGVQEAGDGADTGRDDDGDVVMLRMNGGPTAMSATVAGSPLTPAADTRSVDGFGDGPAASDLDDGTEQQVNGGDGQRDALLGQLSSLGFPRPPRARRSGSGRLGFLGLF